MNTKSLKLLGLSLAVPALFASTNAFADCTDMGNEQWNSLSNKMSQAYQEGNYEEAINYGKSLVLICNRSPIVNMVLSNSYEQLGMEEESYAYVRKASEFTQEYAIPQPMVEKIWLKRAEYELPYKKQVESLKDQLAEKDLELKAQSDAFEAQLVAGSEETNDKVIQEKIAYKDQMSQLKWIGTGVAAGGILIAAVGGGLGLWYRYGDKKANDKLTEIIAHTTSENTVTLDNSVKSAYKDYNNYATAGLIVMGVGLGIGVGGAVMAIVSFIKERNVDVADSSSEVENSEVVSDEASVSFNVSPTSFGLNVAF